MVALKEEVFGKFYSDSMPEIQSMEGSELFLTFVKYQRHYKEYYCTCGSFIVDSISSEWNAEMANQRNRKEIMEFKEHWDNGRNSQARTLLDKIGKGSPSEVIYKYFPPPKIRGLHEVVPHKENCKGNSFNKTDSVKNYYENVHNKTVSCHFIVDSDPESPDVVRVRRYDLRMKFHKSHCLGLSYVPKLQFYLTKEGVEGVLFASQRKRKSHYSFSNDSDQLMKKINALKKDVSSEILIYEDSLKGNEVWEKTGLKEVLEFLKDHKVNAFNVINNSIKYMHGYEKHPQVEQLAKAGFVNYVFDGLQKGASFEKSVKKEIPLPSYVTKENKYNGYSVTKKLILLHQKGKGISEDFMDFISLELKNIIDDLLDIVEHGYTCNEIHHYLVRSWASQAIELRESVELWSDSLRMAAIMECDIQKFPNSLKKTHDLLVRDYNLHANEHHNKRYVEFIKNKLHEDFAFEDSKFIIKAPDSLKEVLEEGQALDHCVGSYSQNIADGSRKILFLREKDEPGKPFVTIEVRNGRLAQCRTHKNVNYKLIPNEDLVPFVEKWARAKGIEL